MILKRIQSDFFKVLLEFRICPVKSGHHNICGRFHDRIRSGKKMNLTIMAVSCSQLFTCYCEFTSIAISNEDRALRRSDKDLGIFNFVALDFSNMIENHYGTFF